METPLNNWKIVKLEDNDGLYFSIYKEFDGCKYRVFIYVDKPSKSVKFWVGVSSGKKKKDLEIFEHKDKKSLGGIKALIWIKQAILSFPEYYNERYPSEKTYKQYICILWSDSKRRDIYKRLEKEGFIFMVEDGRKILMKKL